jgi:hypothetical protein
MKIVWLIGCLFMAGSLSAQDSTVEKVHALQFSGYIKDLHSFTFDKDYSEAITGNLIHNRINLKYRPFKGFSTALEMRNRLFWGEEVSQTPGYAQGLKYPGESEDLSITWFEMDNMLLYSNIDRLWAEYATDTWNVRAGRQRINWGMGTLWNPNDIFNTYNFLDFDYEERPASDAIKAQYLFGNMSHIEVAAARTADSANNSIAAVKYFTNAWTYDIQVLAGIYLSQPTLGLGWAGSLGNVGFKGEAQCFFEKDTLPGQLNWMMEADYVFSKGWYVNGGALLNSEGLDKPISESGITSFNITPRTPMPTKWNIYAGFSKEVTPLFSANLSTVFAPGTNLLLVLPSVQYNLATNLDVNLVGQSFFAEQPGGFEGLAHRWFLRLKWSF